MQNVFFRYAMRFNRKYQRRGHLFGGPYRQAVCLDNTYLLAASLYIHLNPVRAGLKNRAVDYRWSSCGLYVRKPSSNAFVDPQPVLSLVSDNQQTARTQYALLLKGGMDTRPENAMEQEGAVERFCLRMAERFPAIFRKIARAGTSAPLKQSGLADLTEIEDLLREHASAGTGGPQTVRARKYMVEQLVARGFRREEIASRLGVSRKTIYNILATHFASNLKWVKGKGGQYGGEPQS
jgi:putative transposase